MSARDPVEVERMIRDTIGKHPVGTAAAVYSVLHHAGLLRDDADLAARERAAREKALMEAAGEAEKLIRNAYNMGFSEGMRERAYGGVPWSESRPKREGAAAILALIEKEPQ